MKLAFYCNYLNHHQVCIADALYEQQGEDFVFVATLPRNEKELKGGEDYSTRTYCLLAGETEEGHRRALELARKAEVCVFGACSQEYAVERAKQKDCGLAFELGERWLKRGWINVLSPVLRGWWMNYMRYYRKKPFYKLCSSAFTAEDDVKLGCYKGRHFKWGYFTQVDFQNENFSSVEHELSRIPHELSINSSTTCINHKSLAVNLKIMWCARFIDWKHPELALDCAKRLKAYGYDFKLDMYGDGPLRKEKEAWVRKQELDDVVKFHGNVPNAQIHEAMRNSDIFLFTSDRQEGWGAVANEAMSAGCCLVGSDEIGAVPYLVKDNVSGMIFKSRNAIDLCEKVKYLFDNPEYRVSLAKQGMQNMQNLWNARNAAKSLLQIINDIQNNRETSVTEGPCSKA